MLRARDLVAGNQQRRHVPAIYILEFSVLRIFVMITVAYFSPRCFCVKNRFTDAMMSVKGMRAMQVSVYHALQRGSQQRCRNSLATHIGQHHGQSILRIHRVEEVAANLLAGQISAAHFGVTALREWSPP